jgi:hypothetical protein
MCPVCLTAAMLIAGSVTASGGIAVLAVRKFSVKSAEGNRPHQTQSQTKEDHHG